MGKFSYLDGLQGEALTGAPIPFNLRGFAGQATGGSDYFPRGMWAAATQKIGWEKAKKGGYNLKLVGKLVAPAAFAGRSIHEWIYIGSREDIAQDTINGYVDSVVSGGTLKKKDGTAMTAEEIAAAGEAQLPAEKFAGTLFYFRSDVDTDDEGKERAVIGRFVKKGEFEAAPGPDKAEGGGGARAAGGGVPDLLAPGGGGKAAAGTAGDGLSALLG